MASSNIWHKPGTWRSLFTKSGRVRKLQECDDSLSNSTDGIARVTSHCAATLREANPPPKIEGAFRDGESVRTVVDAILDSADTISPLRSQEAGMGYGGGYLRYYGPHSVHGRLRCGVELDEAVGLNNGNVHGHQYFACDPHRGVLVVPKKVTYVCAGCFNHLNLNADDMFRVHKLRK